MVLNSWISVVMYVSAVIEIIPSTKQIKLEIKALVNQSSNAVKNSEAIAITLTYVQGMPVFLF